MSGRTNSPAGAIPVTDKSKSVLTIKRKEDEKDVCMPYGSGALLHFSGTGAMGVDRSVEPRPECPDGFQDRHHGESM
jgi:hypothetical protein